MKIDTSDKPSAMEISIGNEVQRRANQLFVGCKINLIFYKIDEIDDLLEYYEKNQLQEQVESIACISEKNGTWAILSNSDDGEANLTIALLVNQSLNLLVFESVKTLVWYKYFLPIETVTDEQLDCLAEGKQALDLATQNINKVTDERIGDLATNLTGIFELMETLKSRT